MPKGYRNGQGWCLKRLQGHGYRLTLTREAIINVLSRYDKHLSAEEIFNEVIKIHTGAGLASIYRTLDLLIELGFVHKLEFGEGKARYELVNEKENHLNHHHLVCTGCGKILDYDELLDEEIEMAKKTALKLTEKFKFIIQRHNVQYFGTCSVCSEK